MVGGVRVRVGEAADKTICAETRAPAKPLPTARSRVSIASFALSRQGSHPRVSWTIVDCRAPHFHGDPMRLLAALPLLVALNAAVAQRSAPRPRSEPLTAQRSSASQQLIRNEDGWAAALVKRDGNYFERMLAPTFVYTEDAKMMTRADVLHDATSGPDSVTSAHNEDMVVHEAGSVTAVVTGLLVVEGRSRRTRFVHRYRFTDTWVKQSSGDWQIVAAQDYLIPRK
jgi:ketosteroid isomerase-like protein